jgi:DNA-binding XRE family transcriptional regulator
LALLFSNNVVTGTKLTKRGDTIITFGSQGEVVTAVVTDVSMSLPEKAAFMLRAGEPYGPQLRTMRVGLEITIRELAKRSNVSPNTIVRIEKGEPCHESSATSILNALNSLV